MLAQSDPIKRRTLYYKFLNPFKIGIEDIDITITVKKQFLFTQIVALVYFSGPEIYSAKFW